MCVICVIDFLTANESQQPPAPGKSIEVTTGGLHPPDARQTIEDVTCSPLRLNQPQFVLYIRPFFCARKP
jgi:hypothetical protein